MNRLAQYHFTTTKKVLVTGAVFCVLLTGGFVYQTEKANAVAGINRTINFQGKLINNPSKTNVTNNSYSVVFTFYDRASGGTVLWQETQTVTTYDGIFRVNLGSVTPIPSSFNFNWDGIYLGMKVGTDSEMTPRIQMAAVPYAFNAEKVSGLTVQDDAGNASTSATLRIANNKTVTLTHGLTFSGADSKTINFGSNSVTFTTSTDSTLTLPSTGTLATLAGNEEFTNKTIGSTGLIFSGATTDITTASNEDLTLTPNGSGNLVLGGDGDTGVTIGTPISREFPLLVRSGISNLASFVVDNLNSGNLFSASSAGSTKFTIGANGEIGLGLSAGLPNFGSSANCLVSNGTGAGASWGSCGGANLWQQVSGGLLLPGNLTQDVLFGGVSTSAAKFAFTNAGNTSLGTPTASISANSGFNNTYLTGTGNLGTTNKQTLSFGGSTTGLINILNSAGSAFSTFDTLNSRLGIGTSVPLAALDVNGAASVAGALTFYTTPQIQSTARQTLTLGGNTTGSIQFNPGGLTNPNLFLKNNGDIGINTTNPLATFDVRVNIANNGGTLAIASVSGRTSFAGLLVDNSGLGDLFTASTSGLTKFRIANDGTLSGQYSNWNIQATGSAKMTSWEGGGLSDDCSTSDRKLLWNSETKQFSCDADLGANLQVQSFSDAVTELATFTVAMDIWDGAFANITPASTNSNILVSVNIRGTSDDANDHNPVFIIRRAIGSDPVCTGGSPSTAVGGEFVGGFLTTAAQDWGASVTFSDSPATMQNVRYTVCTTTTGTDDGNTDEVRIVLSELGSSSPTIEVSNWRVYDGAIAPKLASVLDLLVGGQSTSSAKFGILNVNGSASPVASLSATTSSGGTGAGLVFDSGTSSIQSLRRNTLTIGGSTTGAIQFNAGGNGTLFIKPNGDIGTGTNNTDPRASFDIRANTANGGGTVSVASVSGQTSFAALVVNNNGTGDIFAASKSGAKKFAVLNNGNIQFAGTSNFLTTLASGATADRTLTIPNSGATDTFCLETAANCGGGSVNLWQQASGGVLAPGNLTQDLLLGATASTSSKFAFINSGSTSLSTPVASISAQNASGQTLILAGDGSIQTTRNNTLSLGGSTTGNITLAPSFANGMINVLTGNLKIGNGSPGVTLDGEDAYVEGTLEIDGNATFDGLSLLATNATTITLGSTGADTIILGNGGADTITIGNVASTGVSITDNNWSINTSGVASFITGSVIGSQTFTTNNIADSGALTIGTGANGLLSLSPNGTGNINLSGDFDSQVLIGANSATTEFPLFINSGIGSNATLAVNNLNSGDLLTASASGTTRFTISNAGAIGITSGYGSLNDCLKSGGSASSAVTWGSCGSSGAAGTWNIDALGTHYAINTTLNTLFGGTSTASAKVNIAGSLTTGTSALIINQLENQDIFTASSSGTSRFALGANGEIKVGSAGNLSSGISGQCLISAGNGAAVSWGGCASGAGAGWFTLQSAQGTLYPVNTTLDLLVGGISTSSAKFGILNSAGSTAPVASLSATTSSGGSGNGLVFDSSNASIQSLRKNTLTIGGNTTGSIQFSAGGNSTLFIKSNGDIGSGTNNTNPRASFDIRANTANGGGTVAVASVSGKTSFAALVINNSGTGDLFTASSEGQTRFRMTNNGSVNFGGDYVSASNTAKLTNNGSPSTINALGDQGSLVPNASFEANSINPGLADGWVVAATSSGLVTSDTSTASHGDKSMRVQMTNTSAAFYSACFPISTEDTSSYALAFNWRVTAAPIPTLRANMATYTSKANCNNNTAATFTNFYSTTAITANASWQPSNATAGQITLTTAGDRTWGRIQFFVACTTNCTNSTINIDGVKLDMAVINSGGLDVAENYTGVPENLAQPGDVVRLKKVDGKTIVVPADSVYGKDVIGVVTTKPGLLLDDEMDGPKVPVVLAGRIPVKVSTANGKIKVGDKLTSSSIPGVAVKAVKSGQIIGTAMEDYDEEEIGQIVVHFNLQTNSGSIADSYENVRLESNNFGQEVLDAIKAQENQGLSGSEIVTDRLIASVEIVVPKLTVNELHARKIIVDEIEGLTSINSRLADLESKVATLSATQSSTSSLSVSVEYSTISSQLAENNTKIEQQNKLMKMISEQLASSSASSNYAVSNSNQISSLEDNLRVKGNALIEGVLNIVDSIITNNLIVNGLSTFFGDVVFKSNTSFDGQVTFSSDIGGSAVINKNEDKVRVDFDKDFDQTPILNASVTFDERKDDKGNIRPLDEIRDAYFKEHYEYIIVDKSKSGFVIVLNKKAVDDITFTWTAIRVKDPRNIQSRKPD